MISLLRKYRRALIISIVVVFVASIGFMGISGVRTMSMGDAVAKVGKNKISYKDYSMAYDKAIQSYHEMGVEVNEEIINMIRQRVLQGLINNEILYISALEYGIGVSNAEIGYDIQNSAMFNDKDGKFDKRAYEWAVNNVFRMNVQEFENNIKKYKLSLDFNNLLESVSVVTPREAKTFYRVQNGKNMPSDKLEETAGLMRKAKQQALMNEYTKYFNDNNEIIVSKKL